MNIQESDILNALLLHPYVNQRALAEHSGHSLGIVNRSIKSLMEKEYLDENMQLTEMAKNEIRCKAPKNAIILAAGFGMRMAPINMEVPKAFLEVDSQPLIERIINQLHEVGIKDICIVVGFMKEHFDYLIDKYGVNLIINTHYSEYNNLYSLKLVLDKLSNTYIIPSDVWCGSNPFRKNELYSWYMVSDLVDNESEIRVNRKMELVRIKEENGGNAMLGIAYLLEEQADQVKNTVNKLMNSRIYEKAFWEEALYKDNKMILTARVVRSSDNVEINTYEQLREIDSSSKQLKSKAISIAAQTLNVSTENITDIAALKNGMTNRSFIFYCKGRKYIMRIPGEGTDKLIDRSQEAAVYQLIKGKDICDKVIYINPQNWTIFYWAYWMVWCVAAPFFMGSISKGRTVKQVVLGAYTFGLSSTFISFIILGNYSLGLQTSGKLDVMGIYEKTGDLYQTIIAVIHSLPVPQIVLVLLIVSMIAFYATSFDSITLVASAYSYKEIKSDEDAGKGMKLFWAILLILLPIVLIFNENSMNNLQTVSMIAAFPIGIVIILIISSFIKDAKKHIHTQKDLSDKVFNIKN